MILKNPSKPKFKKGFSMVEMLAVVLIMALLLTGGAVGIRNMSTGKGSSIGIAMIETLVNEARDTAIGKNSRARLCIVDFEGEDNADDIFRSKVFVSYLDGGDWIVANRAILLPAGSYFSEAYSQKFSDSNSGSKLSSVNMNFKYLNNNGTKRSVNAGAKLNGKVFFYEFNSEGILIDDGSNDISRALFVVGTGVRPPGQDPILSGDKDLDGIVIWKKGTVSRVRSVAQITSDTNPTVF